MKKSRSKYSFIRLCSILLTMILTWVLLEPEDDKWENHWAIVTGLAVVAIILLLIVYLFLR